MDILKKNLFRAQLVPKVLNHFITGTQSNHCPTSPMVCFTLNTVRTCRSFFCYYSKKIRRFIKHYWLDIKLVFSSLRLVTCLAFKTLTLAGSVHVWFSSLRVWAVMPVMSAKRSGVFSTRVKEHLASDRTSHIFKHLQNS